MADRRSPQALRAESAKEREIDAHRRAEVLQARAAALFEELRRPELAARARARGQAAHDRIALAQAERDFFVAALEADSDVGFRPSTRRDPP